MEQIRDQIRLVTRTLLLVWAASPAYSLALGLLLLVQGILPAVSVWVSKGVIDAAVAAFIQGGSGGSTAGLLLQAVIYLLLSAAASGLAPLSGGVQGLLNERVTAHVGLTLMRKSAELPGLTYHESPKFHDELRLVQNEAIWRPSQMVSQATLLVRGLVFTASLMGLLWRFSPLVPLIALAVAIPQGYIFFRQQKNLYQAIAFNTPEARWMNYFQASALSDTLAKEMRMFGLFGFFADRYRTLFEGQHRKMRGVRMRQAFWSLGFTVAATLVNGAVFIWVVRRTAQGSFTPGDLTLFIQSSMAIPQNLGMVVMAGATIYEALLFARRMFDFLQMAPDLPVCPPDQARPVPGRLAEGIEFRNVSFTYPGGKQVLKEVSFTIRPGEIVALVGENGAGKSTLVKLLSRFYDPTEGAILLDGHDLRLHDLEGWRRQCGALFQDFARYQLPVRQNIGLGEVSALADEAAIQRAAKQSGAEPMIRSLPGGYDQQLGRQFEGGVELSGGEWQKIALARAFMRNAPVLILDEPTSAFDPKAEHEFHERLRELCRARTTLIISHRLSTVKMADRIIMLEHGRVIELGSHAELLERRGRYAEMYQLQARRYG